MARTSFTEPTNGQPTDAGHVAQFIAPVNGLEDFRDLLTSIGDLVTHDGAVPKRLPAGVIGQVLTTQPNRSAGWSDLPATGEPPLGSPDVDGKVLASTAAGVRSWTSLPPVGEPPLGNPDVDGKVLASTASGVRSWTSLPTPGLTSMARLCASADQAATSHDYTTLSWDTEDIDTDAYHDAGAPTIVTIPATGTYSVEVVAKSKAAPQGGTAGLQILLNGSTVIASTRAGTPVSAPASLGTITDLEAYWPMEETGGTSLADTSGSGHTGASSGTTVTSNGLGGYARPGATNTMNMGAVLPATTGFTWATRIYFPSVINTGVMAVTGLSLTRTNAGAISVTGGGSNFSTGGVYAAGVWYHLALSWDQASGALKIYLNGSIVKTHAWTPGYVLSTSGNLTMGGGSYPIYDYVQVFNKALSDAEVLKLATYTSTSPGDNTLTLNSASAPATGTTLMARVPARAFALGDTLSARWWQDSGVADNIEAVDGMPSFTVIRLG